MIGNIEATANDYYIYWAGVQHNRQALYVSIVIRLADTVARSLVFSVLQLVASIINSPFLIQYLSVFKVEDAFVTLMEYVEGIDLKKLMSIQRFLPEDVLRLFVVQMFLGLGDYE